jgi:hypothetical protein
VNAEELRSNGRNPSFDWRKAGMRSSDANEK